MKSSSCGGWRSRSVSLLGLALGATGLLPPGAGAQTTYYMSQNYATNWSLAALWSGGVPPGSGVAKDDIADLARAYGNVAGSKNLTNDTSISLGGMYIGITGANNGWLKLRPSGGSAITFTNLSGGSAFLLKTNNGISTAIGVDIIYTPLVLGANLSVSNNSGYGGLEIAGTISESGGARSISIGTLSNANQGVTLSGSNSFSGGVTLNNGTLNVNDKNALGTGSLSIGSGGTAVFTLNNTTLSNNISIAGAMTSGGNGSYSGTLSGGGSLFHNASANFTMSLTGTNTGFSGSITNTGTLTINNKNSLGSGTLYMGDGVTASLFSKSVGGIALTGADAVSNNVVLLNDGNTIGSNQGAIELAGAISGNYGLTKNGTGPWVLSGNNSFAGNLTNNLGSLQLGHINAAGLGTLVLNGGRLGASADLGSGNGVTNAVQLLAADNTITNDFNLKFSGNITGAGGITKSGGGTLTLSGANSYGGNTTNNAGLLQATSPGALPGYGTAGKVVINSAATLAVNVSGAGQWVAGDIQNVLTNAVFNPGAAFGLDTTSGSFSYGTAITNSGMGLTKLGANTLTLTASNLYTGLTTIGAGTLQIGNGATDGSIASSSGIVNNGALTYNTTGTNTFNNLISGTGSLTKLGAGTLVLGTTNTYSGGTTLSAGTLLVSTNYALGSGTLALNGGTLASANTSFEQVLTNPVTIGGTINVGVYQLSAGITFSNSTMDLGGATRTIIDGRATTVSIYDTIQNGGLILYTGVGSSGGLFLYGTNTYSGGTYISNGVAAVQISNDGALGAVNSVVTNAGGILSVGGINTLSHPFVLTGTAGFKSGNGGRANITNSVSGTGSFEANGGTASGTIVLGGVNTFTGNTVFNGGAPTLLISNALALQNSTLTMTKSAAGTLGLKFGNGIGAFTVGGLAGATNVLLQAEDGSAIALTVGGNTSNTTYAGSLSDGGAGSALTKTGSGTPTLSGANSYNGGTTINSGTLALAGSGTVGSGAIDIKSSALFDVSGTTAGSYTLASGQSLINRGTVAGGLIIGSGASVSGGGGFNGAVINGNGGFLTPGLGGDTNFFKSLTLAGGSTNSFWVGATAALHDLSVVSNSLAYTGDGSLMPRLKLDFSLYNRNFGDTIVLYDNLFSGMSDMNGTNRWFTFQDALGSVTNLYNGTLFSAVTDGGSATNLFRIAYNFDAGGNSQFNDIALSVIPEPATLNLLVLLGSAYWLRRRMRRPRQRWDR